MHRVIGAPPLQSHWLITHSLLVAAVIHKLQRVHRQILQIRKLIYLFLLILSRSFLLFAIGSLLRLSSKGPIGTASSRICELLHHHAFPTLVLEVFLDYFIPISLVVGLARHLYLCLVLHPVLPSLLLLLHCLIYH